VKADAGPALVAVLIAVLVAVLLCSAVLVVIAQLRRELC
jgi:hypothetical protein